MQNELQSQILSKLANLENLSTQVELLIDEVSSINSGLKNLEPIAPKQQPPIPQEVQPQKAQDGLMPTRESSAQTFCRLYNAGVEDSNKRDEFTQRYRPTRIGVAGSSSTTPDFQTSRYGDYFAVVVEGGTRYAVVPYFDVTLQRSNYGPGAIGQVFDCPNYDPQLRYRRVKVVKPAFFEPDPAKQRWTLKEKGELDLGQGE